MVSAFNVDLAADNTNANGYYMNMYMHIYMHFYVISVFKIFFFYESQLEWLMVHVL